MSSRARKPGCGRREFLATLGAAAACGRNRPPNILLALADDQSWQHTQASGDPNVRTANFDRVAREGVRFEHSFCASPSCTPSRTSILTGRHMWQTGEGGVLYGALDPAIPVFPHLLADAGYHTGFTGKGWGPGEWQAAGLQRHPLGKEYNRRTFAHAASSGISDGDYAANFQDFLNERPAPAPFFFWFGCREPHRPYEDGYGARQGKRLDSVRVPPFWPDAGEVRSDILDYCAEIDWFDRELGSLLAILEKAGELDRTLVVVTSDNGMPFPRAKANLYDWGVRMPLAIRWPARIQGGRVRSDFVSHVDLAPTFLEAAGLIARQGMSGSSLLQPGGNRDCVYTGMERHTWCRPDGATYPMRAIRTKDFLYIRNFAPDRWPTGGPDFISSNKTAHGDVDEGPTKTFMVAHQKNYARQFDLGFGKRPVEELYDLAKDEFQMNNVAADAGFSAEKQQLWAKLRQYLEKTGDPRISGHDPWQALTYRQTAGFGAAYNRSLPESVREEAAGRGSHKPE
jgi:N-sulfoglucosamine sulfohydrolase